MRNFGIPLKLELITFFHRLELTHYSSNHFFFALYDACNAFFELNNQTACRKFCKINFNSAYKRKIFLHWPPLPSFFKCFSPILIFMVLFPLRGTGIMLSDVIACWPNLFRLFDSDIAFLLRGERQLQHVLVRWPTYLSRENCHNTGIFHIFILSCAKDIPSAQSNWSP